MIGQMPKHHKRSKNIYHFDLRDRPFNLQGGYGFLFHSEFFFRTTQELEYFLFLPHKAQIFFPKFNIRLYDKNSESDYFFFPPPNQNIFFSNIGNQNIFLEKNHNFPLQVKWSFPYSQSQMKTGKYVFFWMIKFQNWCYSSTWSLGTT
jgi:hypothetical protein